MRIHCAHFATTSMHLKVSSTEVRIYYDAFGPGGRWLCVAVSTDGGLTFTKPHVNLIEFNGSKANNIVAGKHPTTRLTNPL
jgi:hypothetical protein